LKFNFYKPKLHEGICLNFVVLTFYLPLFYFIDGDAKMVMLDILTNTFSLMHTTISRFGRNVVAEILYE